MHDTTCGPALVDIAGMRDALAEAGSDPRLLNPGLPVDVSVDHSIAVDRFGAPEAVRINMEREAERNARAVPADEVGAAARSTTCACIRRGPASCTPSTWSSWPPSSAGARRRGAPGFIPDTLIGTDSHTPMINALGVLGWGVGGLEAEGVMFGLPVMMRLPDVIGVRLTGRAARGQRWRPTSRCW